MECLPERKKRERPSRRGHILSGLEDGEIDPEDEELSLQSSQSGSKTSDEDISDLLKMTNGKPREVLTAFVTTMPSPAVMANMDLKTVCKSLSDAYRFLRLQDRFFMDNDKVLQEMRSVRDTESNSVHHLLQSLMNVVRSPNLPLDVNILPGVNSHFHHTNPFRGKLDALQINPKQLDMASSPRLLSPESAIGVAALPIPSSMNLNNMVCPAPPPLPHLLRFPPPPILERLAPVPQSLSPMPSALPPHPSPAVFPDFSQPPPPVIKRIPETKESMHADASTPKTPGNLPSTPSFSSTSIPEAQTAPPAVASRPIEQSNDGFEKSWQSFSVDNTTPKRSSYFSSEKEFPGSQLGDFRGMKPHRFQRMDFGSFERKRSYTDSRSSFRFSKGSPENERSVADQPFSAKFTPFSQRRKPRWM